MKTEITYCDCCLKEIKTGVRCPGLCLTDTLVSGDLVVLDGAKIPPFTCVFGEMCDSCRTVVITAIIDALSTCYKQRVDE